ncbi:MAG: hypothetical protein GY715_04745 [Planctomycetes bacterium]|nr:hypothetical protein [Planctomycetota bacterium]
MKRFAITGVLLAAGAIGALGLAPPQPFAAGKAAISAGGQGTMAFSSEHETDDDTGIGYLRFGIRGGETVSGTLLFAAEHHHGMFPDIVVQLGNVQEASFKEHSVKFTGQGLLHDDQVTITVRAWDHGKSKADRFAIECVDPAGHVRFQADGHLVRGDIRIGDSDGEVQP